MQQFANRENQQQHGHQKQVHIQAKLAERAKAEGVSLNTLVLALVAEGLGRNVA